MVLRLEDLPKEKEEKSSALRLSDIEQPDSSTKRFRLSDLPEEDPEIIEKSMLGKGRAFFNNKLSKIGELDQDEKTTLVISP